MRCLFVYFDFLEFFSYFFLAIFVGQSTEVSFFSGIWSFFFRQFAPYFCRTVKVFVCLRFDLILFHYFDFLGSLGVCFVWDLGHFVLFVYFCRTV